MIQIVEKENKNGFITMFDDDGQINIQMEKDDILSIIKSFDSAIKTSVDLSCKINLLDGDYLDLNLTFYEDDEFCIEGRHHEVGSNDGGSYFHDFELEGIEVEDWNGIVKFVNE